MVSFEELERLAAAGGRMPEGLTTNAQAAYLALRSLYGEFRRGTVDKEQASREKRLIRREFARRKDADEYIKGVIHTWQDNIHKSEMLRAGINRAEDKSPAELFLMAVECISLMTGDEAFRKNAEKVRQIQLKLKEV